MNRILTLSLLIAVGATLGLAQNPPLSPPEQTSVTINGKTLTIKYSAPSMRGRKIFGASGALQPDNTVWRAGANEATAFHTDADLDMNGLSVPKGDYTLYVFLDPAGWKLIVNKQTGQWGTEYHQDRDLGRVAMHMSKPPSPIEKYKMTLSKTGGNKGSLQLEWENVIATVPFTVK
ncbi:MAG TPA: DUF2911 domain-containing protein [Bryobacteraceae bacterium]|nr:DUF2911 domain-containing protein [Bryobacteraceae bacterium]